LWKKLAESMLLMGEEAAVWTEEDDKVDEKMQYGRWGRYTAKTTLAEEYKVHPPVIWPHWSEGVPTKLRRKLE
jgi:hypothetical protein